MVAFGGMAAWMTRVARHIGEIKGVVTTKLDSIEAQLGAGARRMRDQERVLDAHEKRLTVLDTLDRMTDADPRTTSGGG